MWPENYMGLLLYLMIVQAVLYSTSVHSYEYGSTCPKGLVNKKCSGGCSKQCGFWNTDASCKPCQSGCVCPGNKYETWNNALQVKCVRSSKKCRCSGGQVYNENGNACTLKCRNPVLRPECAGQKIAKCECPANRPIWHNGRCIKFDQCVCKSKQSKGGCQECNKCMCNKGKLGGCTRLGCPNANTEQGARQLASGGCYRNSTSGMCIYYSFCPDDSQTGNCGCQNCTNDLVERILSGEGGWGEVNGRCIFTVPGPEPTDSTCKDVATSGTTTCEQCNTCECVHGARMCTQKTCPKPQYGCVVYREYPWAQKRCYFVSPCPRGAHRCNYLFQLPEVTEEHEFCYMFNANHGKCEFMSPCPKTCGKEAICNGCNKCTCNNGRIKCQKAECGDPLRQGCWTRQSGQCLFTSPCPWDSYSHQCVPEEKPVDEDMIKDGCWSPLYGKCTFYYPCPY